MLMFVNYEMEKIYYVIVCGWIEEVNVFDYLFKEEFDKIVDKFVK